MGLITPHDLTLDDYQDKAVGTAFYPKDRAITYLALALAGEAGEVANAIKKMLRDDGGQLTAERGKKIVDELGDVLWYVAMLAWEMDVPLGFLADKNLKKLAARAKKGTLHGEGDER